MSKLTNMKEIVQTIAEGKIEIVDCSINGQCSKCGNCCTNFLPISQRELDVIKDYVIANNIKPQKQVLVMQNMLTCPYYDGKNCLIYEARPLICKEFYCYKKPDVQMVEKFEGEERIGVDMWAVAQKIEMIRR